MRKKLVACLMGLTIAACGGAVLAGCGEKETDQPNEFEKVYSLYVANAAESGETPLSYSEWLDSIKGEKGDKGDKGDAGTNGTDGKDGTNGTDGKDGTNGTDGVTPHIGANGNWYIGDIDTGIKAAGTDGEKGDKGDAGTNGTDGTNGTNGTNGKDGISIENVTVTYTTENNIPYMVFTFYFSEGEPVVQKIALEQPTQDQVVNIRFELDEYQVGTPADQIYLIVQYSQSGEQRISLADLTIINGDYNLDASGSYNITVEIEGYSQQLTLNIVEQQTDEIVGISFTQNEYQVGTYAKEIYLIVQYSQSVDQVISLAMLADNIKGEYDLKTVGSYKITVEYEGYSQPLTLNIVEQVADTVQRIYLDNNTNNEYLVGTPAEEIYLIVQYSQSGQQRISLAELAGNITGEYDLNIVGSYNIKVQYDNFTAYLTLNIVEDYTARLSLNDNSIVWFDDIDEDNLKYLRASYQKGEVREKVQLTSDMLSELPVAGEMGEVTVSYLGAESTIWVQRIAESRAEYIANNSVNLNGHYESQGMFNKQIKLGDEVFSSDDYIRVTNENGYTFFIQPTVDMLIDINTQEALTLNDAGNYEVNFDQNIVGFIVFGNFMIEVFDMTDATIQELWINGNYTFRQCAFPEIYVVIRYSNGLYEENVLLTEDMIVNRADIDFNIVGEYQLQIAYGGLTYERTVDIKIIDANSNFVGAYVDNSTELTIGVTEAELKATLDPLQMQINLLDPVNGSDMISVSLAECTYDLATIDLNTIGYKKLTVTYTDGQSTISCDLQLTLIPNFANATIEETLTFSETLANTIGLRSIELYNNGYGIITFSYESGNGYVSYSFDEQIYTVNFAEMDMLLTKDAATGELVPCEVVGSEKVYTSTELDPSLTLTVGNEYIKVELGMADNQIHVFTLPKSAIYDTNKIKIMNTIFQLNEDGTVTPIGD